MTFKKKVFSYLLLLVLLHPKKKIDKEYAELIALKDR